MIETKKIVWAIFDDGEQSAMNALKDNDDYKVISFGILKKDSVEPLDMVRDIKDIINDLDKYPKPDIIAFSPPCIAFSKASGIEKGMNAYLNYSDLSERSKESYDNSMYIFENSPIKGVNKKEFALMSKKMVDNTLEIIRHYQPKHWYIENPRLSLMWKYIENGWIYPVLDPIHNITNYGAYNHPVKKPTIFLSNIKLDLRTDVKGMKFLKWDKDFTNKSMRSSIPKTLLQEIFYKFWKEEYGN